MLLQHGATEDYVSTGVERLDTMLDGKGYYRSSSILVSGTPGTGKTSLAATFVDAGCARGETAVYAAFEESPGQIIRNMRSIGIDLLKWVDKGLLHFHAVRPSAYGLETHLAMLHRLISKVRPSLLIADPITNLASVGAKYEVESMLRRLVDMLKSENITALFTAPTSENGAPGASDTSISSLMDTWLTLRDIEANGERTRGMYVRKSRGMSHSNQIRELLLTNRGIDLRDVYIGPAGVLTGSARLSQEAEERVQAEQRSRALQRKRDILERKRRRLEERMDALRIRYQHEIAAVQLGIEAAENAERARGENRKAMAVMRWADSEANNEHS